MSETLGERPDAKKEQAKQALLDAGYTTTNGFVFEKGAYDVVVVGYDDRAAWNRLPAYSELIGLLAQPTEPRFTLEEIKAVIDPLQPQADQSASFRSGYWTAINNVMYALRHLQAARR